MNDNLSAYRIAAENGDGDAAFSLGLLYENGDGVTADLSTAVMWYEKGASLNHAASMINLSCLYINGSGVEQDFARGLSYAERALSCGISGFSASIALLNLALIYRLSKQHRDYAKSVLYCEKAIAENPDDSDLYEQLCIAELYRGCYDSVAPVFVSEDGKLLTEKESCQGIRNALEAFYKREGIKGYRGLFKFFREEARREDLSMPLRNTKLTALAAYQEGMEDYAPNRNWEIAAQLRYLIEAKKPLDFNDPKQYAGIKEIAALYAMVKFPTPTYGHELMFRLAKAGYGPAYTFLLLHNTFFYEKDFSSPMCDLRYKAELVGWQTYGQRLEVDLRNEEKATPPNRELIDRYAFIIGVGCESRARDTFSQESAERLWNSAADYYRKMDFSDSFVSLSRPRLAELRLQHAIETKKDSNQKWQSAELASALKAYQVISCFTTESSKAESAIAALRVFTLLNAKAAACPADALNALFSPEEAEKLETALLPFEPQSVDLITMPIVESTYGLSHRFSRKTLTRNLYACRHFEFLYRLKTEYPSELLSALCFDPDVLEKLVARLTPQVLSEACAERIFLYLYMTQGKVPKKQMPRVLSACEKLLESSVSGQAAYTLYCLYSGEGGVKKDMAKAYAALIQGMEKRYPDAVYETALLAKKGKLAAFGIAKTEYRTYLKLAAELGHPEAQKKLG